MIAGGVEIVDFGKIRTDLECFQIIIKKLGSEVGKASALWEDEKYSELSAAIRVIADMSKNMIVAGDRCCASVDKFAQISEEQY